MRRAGFTLVELIVYSVLALLVLGMVAALLSEARRSFAHTEASYRVGAQLEAAVYQLRTDLAETALSTIRSYPAGTAGTEAPGASLASARIPAEPARLQTNRHGAPAWGTHTFYALVDDGSHQTGRLVRWQSERSDGLEVPLPTSVLPSALGNERDGKVILRSVVLPNVEIRDVDAPAADRYGGFRVSFVRDEEGVESISPWNPAQVTTGTAPGLEPEGNTLLVEVELKTWSSSSGTGRPTWSALTFRVCPRH